MSVIYPKDLYRASALQAYLSRGYVMEVAIELAIEAANKMQAEVDKDTDYDNIE